MARRKARIDTVLPLLPGLREFIEAERERRNFLSRALSQARRVKDGVKKKAQEVKEAVKQVRKKPQPLAWENSPLAKAGRWMEEKEARWEILWEAAQHGAKIFVKRRRYHYGWGEVVEEILRELVRRMENRRLGKTRGKKRIPPEKRWYWTEVPLKDLRRRAFSDARYIAKEPKVITNLTYRPFFRAQDLELKKKMPQNADLISLSVFAQDRDGNPRELPFAEQGAHGVDPEKLLLALEEAVGNLGLALA